MPRSRQRVRDLSHPIRDGMQVYPGDPDVEVTGALEIARDGVAVTALHLGSHTGTHVDAPSHTIAGGRTMADVAVDELVGDALVVHVPDLGDEAVIGPADLGDLPDRVPHIVLISTGWERHFGTDRALRHPAVSESAARLLLDRGMRVLGVDTLSPDPTGAGSTDFPVHAAVLGADGLIVENLAGLEALEPLVRVGVFPLRLEGDGAPCRAVAFD